MNNIFKGAKFGDKFLTRDSRIAIYWHKDPHKYGEDKICYNLILENEDVELICTSDGLNFGSKGNWEEDIVSRYQEPIDEEKLDELGYKYADSISHVNSVCNMLEDAYEAGYRKAKNS